MRALTVIILKQMAVSISPYINKLLSYCVANSFKWSLAISLREAKQKGFDYGFIPNNTQS